VLIHVGVCRIGQRKFLILQGLESLDLACCSPADLISNMRADLIWVCAELSKLMGWSH